MGILSMFFPMYQLECQIFEIERLRRKVEKANEEFAMQIRGIQRKRKAAIMKAAKLAA